MDTVLAQTYASEEAVIAACVKGERWAQQALYESYFHDLIPVCSRYAGSNAESMDLLHEAFIKIFKNIGRYEPNTSLRAWMRRIVVNTCIDAYRKESRRRTDSMDATFNLSSAEADAVSQCTEKEILAAVRALPAAYRTIFNLFAVEGFSHREIGEKLGITESTSRSNLVKARKKLKLALINLHHS